MDITFFVTVSAWVFAVLSGLLVGGRIMYWSWYNFTPNGRLEQVRDIVRNGGAATFPIVMPGTIFIICVVAILSV